MERILFTDLDGTLIDHHTYQPGPAGTAVVRLVERGVRLVFASSKTRGEQEALAEDLGIEATFIVENGGAIITEDHTIKLGVPRAKVRTALHNAATASRAVVRGYGDVGRNEVSAWTGLEGESLSRAIDREWSESFVLDSGSADALAAELADRGIRMSRGGRFWTAHGPHDKGAAVARLIEEHPAAETAAVGDAPNDAPMLSQVDHAFLVRRPSGEWSEVDVPGVIRLDGTGPLGFIQAIERLGW